MPSILLDSYKKNLLDTFVESFSNDEYYMFVSSTYDRTSVENTEYSSENFLSQTIFGKKIDPETIFYSIKEYRWEPNTVYDFYDTEDDLSTKKFYIVLSSDDSASGNYEIYKCLFNNRNAKSTVAPVYDIDIDDQVYRTSDGYVWKYLYSLSEIDYTKYKTKNYIPVLETSSNNSISTASSIDIILVENPTENRGYTNTVGEIEQVFTNTITISGANLNRYSNFYNGQTLYVTNEDNISKLYNITNYQFDTNSNVGILTLSDKDNFITTICSYKIFPKIEITGDGEGAKAIPYIKDGSIESIIIIDNGSDYTVAQARVVDPLYNFDSSLNTSNYITALVRPIISPKNGHGSDIPSELKSNSILIYNEITNSDNMNIPTSNEFSKIGIVKNPIFDSSSPLIFDNRLKIELNAEAAVEVGETLTQTVGISKTFTGRIHELISNQEFFLVDYVGPYHNNPIFGDISIDDDILIETEAGQFFNINNIEASPYFQRTGEVIYMSNFNAIERTNSSNEEFKIIIEF